MSTIVNALAPTSPVSPGNTVKPAATDPLASESTFLTLLVSQLQNQDPLAPVDSNQFVTQLTQYSQLEQLIGIHSDTTTLSKVATPPGTATAAATTPATSAAASGMTPSQANTALATTSSSTNQTTTTTGAN